MGAFCQTENFATDALWVKLSVSKTANSVVHGVSVAMCVHSKSANKRITSFLNGLEQNPLLTVVLPSLG